MQLLVAYVLLIIVGDFIAYGIGVATEHFSEPASLPVFLASYFFMLWLAWVVAVRITEPAKKAN